MKFSKLLVFIFIFIPVNINALEINSEHAILYNMNEDKVIFEKNSDERTYIASLTKIMTTIVAIENIKNVDEIVTVPSIILDGLVEANASVAGFYPNQKVTYRDLLYGVLLPSGADATRTLAYYISGNEEEFVKLMNQKAKELNLVNTNFVNTSGLDIDNHYSTVKEMSIVLKYALQNPLFKEIYMSNNYTTSDNKLTFKSVYSKYLSRFNIENKYIYGSKTGYTDLAGYCLSTIANYNNIEYLLITTEADAKSDYPLHIIDAMMIYDYYTANYRYLDIINKNDTLLTLDAKYTKEKYLEIKSDIDIPKYLNININKTDFKFIYDGLEEISYFTDKGQIGTLNIVLYNEIIETIPIIYDGNLTFSLIDFISNNLIFFLPIVLIPLIISVLIILKNKKQLSK